MKVDKTVSQKKVDKTGSPFELVSEVLYAWFFKWSDPTVEDALDSPGMLSRSPFLLGIVDGYSQPLTSHF